MDDSFIIVVKMSSAELTKRALVVVRSFNDEARS